MFIIPLIGWGTAGDLTVSLTGAGVEGDVVVKVAIGDGSWRLSLAIHFIHFHKEWVKIAYIVLSSGKRISFKNLIAAHRTTFWPGIYICIIGLMFGQNTPD